jgi:hypothetical protein
MLLEALMDQRSNAGWSFSPSPSSTAMPQLIVNHNFPIEEIQTPKLLRSEVEQMVGQELIKALGNFKQMVAGASSTKLFIQEETKCGVSARLSELQSQ